MELGFALSSEDHPPNELVRQAQIAEQAGFTFALISDHFHPWVSEQGESPFVWSTLGGIAQATERIRVGTGVTCPLIRIHPAIVAQAAATVARMMPGRVVLVLQPQGGPNDWRALFHEAGHTEHFAHTDASLSPEERRLGDNSVTEGWAMLLEYLTTDPVWLERRLDFPRPYEFAAEAAVQLLWIVRRYSAKLLYELEFHTAEDLTALQPRYVELLSDATKVEPSAADYLGDIDDGFYTSEYLRAWAFEAQLRAHLRERFGNAWFSRREAGSLLRELWAEGQKPTADELLREVTGETLELAAIGDRVREALAAG